MQKYHIELNSEERKRLKRYLGAKKHSMESKKHAYIAHFA